MQDEKDELLSILEDNILDVVNKEYQEIIELFGVDVALKLFKHYKGCRIDCPKYFYQLDYVIKIAAQKEDKRERAKISVLCGYTAEWLERKIREYLNQ